MAEKNPEQSLNALRKRIAELESTVEHLMNHEGYQCFQTIFEHSHQAHLVVDPRSKEIIKANQKACDLLGYSREQILLITMDQLHPYETPQVDSFMQSVFAAGRAWTDQLTCTTSSGAILNVEISAARMVLDDNKAESREVLLAMLRDVTKEQRLALSNSYLNQSISQKHSSGPIVAQSPNMKRVLEQIELVAKTDVNVLILGESGTGKELVARAIHHQSKRQKHTLVPVNCAAIPETLFESEFFGHARGAFSGAYKARPGRFEAADGGTLFLDEVGDIPLDLQSKLLRVIQSGEFQRLGEERSRSVNVRILAATHRDLAEEVRCGRFREDLYYRLSVFPVTVPPLRERLDDIETLTRQFINAFCQQSQLPLPRIGEDALEQLRHHDWPGNARELKNVVEQAVIYARGGNLSVFQNQVKNRKPDPASSFQQGGEWSLGDLADLERFIIQRELERCAWKVYGVNGAAERLGLRPTTLYSRMKRLDLKKP